MIRTFKYRLYPTRKQINSLEFQFEGHRFLYNQALSQKKDTYQQAGVGITCFSQIQELIPKFRKEVNNIHFCNHHSLQQTIRRLDKAFNAFFRRVEAGEKPGFPRFKSKDRFNIIHYSPFGNGCQIKENRLYLQNIGCIKVKWHRPIDGEIRTLYIRRRNDKWYVLFVVDTEPFILPKTGMDVGIDVGLTTFATLSDDIEIENPRFYRTSEKRIAKANRRFSRRKKGSRRRRKARILLAKIYEVVTNKRLNFFHQITNVLVQNYDGFAVENLNVTSMIKSGHLSKSIFDAGWSSFLRILKAKAESAGRWYEEVDPRGTSQICSKCGAVVKKSLAIRQHNCPNCGLSIDRDLNAAINILARTEPSWRGAVSLAEARS